MTETVCPLCKLPRPRGAKRCLCNYTFEYDAPSRGGVRVRTPALTPTLLALAAVAAVAAALLLRGQPDLAGHEGVGLLLIPSGVFAVAGGVFDWSWFMRNQRARRFVWLFGRGGARVVYALLGGALIGSGIVLALA